MWEMLCGDWCYVRAALIHEETEIICAEWSLSREVLRKIGYM
jgi:hypothetical protein